MKTYSLRRATLGALIGPLLIAVILVTGIAVWLSHNALSALRDDQMQQEAEFVLLLAKHEATEGEELGVISTSESDRLTQLLGGRTGFRVWSATTVVTQSGSLPPAESAPPQPGFSDYSASGREWRRYAIRYSDIPITIEVIEPIALRQALTGQIARSLVLALLLLVGIVCVIAYLTISAALRPMVQMSREIDSRDDDDLSPLGGHRIPKEIAPLFAAISHLLERLKATIEREREFTDNAAHELRTPLTALKTRAQIAERALAGDPERQEVMAGLIAAANRASSVIDQLLLMTRLNSAGSQFEPCDLSRLTEDVARDLASAAIEKNQDLSADIAPAIQVRGHAGALAMMIRNLIDNAVRYTPAGGTITITLRTDPQGKAILQVADSGPRIAPAERERVFQRFTRLSTLESGSGLGLAIVEQVVKLHRGSITLSDAPPHGLLCEVRLAAMVPAQ